MIYFFKYIVYYLNLFNYKDNYLILFDFYIDSICVCCIYDINLSIYLLNFIISSALFIDSIVFIFIHGDFEYYNVPIVPVIFLSSLLLLLLLTYLSYSREIQLLGLFNYIELKNDD